MEENTKRNLGRPSKGLRHPFTVKLDLERSAKLKEILGTLKISGTDYLGPIIEAHIDTVDVRQLRNQLPEGSLAAAQNSNTSISRSAGQRKLTQEEAVQRAQTLAWKVNLLLDARLDESGQPYAYPAICVGAKKAGFVLSRTRWSLLKEGKVQVVPDECLRAIAKVFDVDPRFLLDADAEIPSEIQLILPQVRIKRLSEVRESAVKALGPVDPEALRSITKVLDQALQQEAVHRYGTLEGSYARVTSPRTECRAVIRRRAFAGEFNR